MSKNRTSRHPLIRHYIGWNRSAVLGGSKENPILSFVNHFSEHFSKKLSENVR